MNKQIFKNTKIFSNFIMKTLKNKLLIGAMAALGAFGNVDAQNTESKNLNQDEMKITFGCRDENNNKTFDCFEEGHFKRELFWGELGGKKARIIYLEDKSRIVIAVINDLQIENSSGKYIRDSGKQVQEKFSFTHNKEILTKVPIGTMFYERIEFTPKDTLASSLSVSSEQEAYEIFGKEYVKRAKELINSCQDSLEFVNLLKKEYNRWKIIEDENGNMVEIKPEISNVFFQRAKAGMPE